MYLLTQASLYTHRYTPRNSARFGALIFCKEIFLFQAKMNPAPFSVSYQLEPENTVTCRSNNQSWLQLYCPALANTWSTSCFVAMLATNQPLMVLCVLFLLVLLRINSCLYSDTAVWCSMDTAEGKGLRAMLWFPNSRVMATVRHILEVKQTFLTDLWPLTASFQSCASGRREEDTISKSSSVTWRVISSPLLITWGSCTCSEIHQKSHGALIFHTLEDTIPHYLSMFFSLTLPCHESQGSSSQHRQHCRHARLCQTQHRSQSNVLVFTQITHFITRL